MPIDDNHTLSPEKQCTKCKKWFPATDEFFRLRKHQDYDHLILCARCWTCSRSDKREHNNKPETKASRVIYEHTEKRKIERRARESTPEFKNAKSLRNKRPEVRARDRERQNSPELKARKKARQSTPEYKEAERLRRRKPSRRASKARYTHTPDGHAKIKAAEWRRTARLRSLPDDFTAADWLYAKDAFAINGVHCCAACGRPIGLWHTLAADHWIAVTDPRPDNPGTVPWNIVPLCHSHQGDTDSCNQTKMSRNAEEWLVERFGRKKASQIINKVERYFESVRRRLR